jgi:hypothetical protein
MLIPPGICLCHIGEAEHVPVSSNQDSTPPHDDDHDENCPAHEDGKIALLKRCAETPATVPLNVAWLTLACDSAGAARAVSGGDLAFVAESPPLYLSLLNLRI